MTDRSELKVSEIFESVQGEGPSAGAAAVFLRLATCNLHCRWCDTKYTWDWQNYDYEREVQALPIASIAERISGYRARRLVITGGEPLLQQAGLSELLRGLPEHVVEIETNGTILPFDGLLTRVDQWNVSPKLANAGDPERLRIRASVLERLRDGGRAWLKFVVAASSDFDEAGALARALAWPSERVLFMPEAATASALRARSGLVRAEALRRDFGFSSRLHIELWDGQRGR